MAPVRTGYWTRRLIRNVGIVALALVVYLIVVTATSHSSQVMFRLSMATGYTSVALIGWALLIGPWRVWRGRSAPVSTDLRRDVGIWGGLFGLAHVATGLFVHLGDPLKYFVYRDTARRASRAIRPVRIRELERPGGDAAAPAAPADLERRLAAEARLTPMEGVAAVDVLGRARSSRVHGLAYQWIEKGNGGWVYVFVPVVLIVAVMQLDGRRRFLARRAAISEE